MASKVSGLLAIFLVLVGVFQGLEARANPEADAEPEAEAEAEANPDADPDAQYGSGSYVDVADENGGQGYYPGGQNGGQGYYPGGQNGGQGYYPGDQNGGQGYYPGGGSYPPNPGMPGGNGGGLPPPYAPIQPGRPSDFVPLEPGGGFQDPDFGRPGDFQDPGFSRPAIARPIEQPDFITPVYGSGGRYPGGSGGQGYNPGLSGGQGYNPGGGQGYNPGGSTCPRDQCCGMDTENCCLGGQKCFNYYEQVCENVRQDRCQVHHTEFCKDHEIPYCRVERKTQAAEVPVQRCTLTTLRHCFTYKEENFNMKTEPYAHDVEWVNEKLQKSDEAVEEECKEVKACSMKEVEEVKTRQVPVRVFDRNETRNDRVCTDRWETGEEQVVGRTTWRTEYQQRCYNVPKQVCSTTPCGSQGCGPGNDVCSATDYTWNERCARPSGAQTPCGSCGSTGTCEDSCSEPRRTAQGSVCQRVKEASCYGNLASCETPGQKCCRTTYERVCQQVPTRVPVMVNMTIPGRPIRKQDCQMVERTIPRYKTEMQTRNETRTRQVCEPKMEERCVNFTLPSFEKVNVDMKEKVELGSIQADIRESNRTKCLNIPRAKVTCMSTKVNKRFVVNKVVCDQRRKTNVCRSIPWSQCTPGSGQECRMVQRTRCVPVCNKSPECTRCDQLRQSGQLDQGCPFAGGGGVGGSDQGAAVGSVGGTCGKFFGRDSASPLPGASVPGQGFQAPTSLFQASNILPQPMASMPEVGQNHAEENMPTAVY